MKSKLVCAWVISIVVMGAITRSEGAVTCGQVASSVASCLAYIQKRGQLSPNCCNGVRGLNAAAKTTPDRQTVCKCLKDLARSVRNINYGLAAGLPGKCGVSIPFEISLKTDCSKVK